MESHIFDRVLRMSQTKLYSDFVYISLRVDKCYFRVYLLIPNGALKNSVLLYLLSVERAVKVIESDSRV